MDFPKFQELVANRTGFAQMADPSATGEYFSDSCGDMYTFYLKIDDADRIADISYFTTGCGFGVATAAIVTELAKGKSIDEASRISAGDIENYLGGYPERKKDLLWKLVNLSSLGQKKDTISAHLVKYELPDLSHLTVEQLEKLMAAASRGQLNQANIVIEGQAEAE